MTFDSVIYLLVCMGFDIVDIFLYILLLAKEICRLNIAFTCTDLLDVPTFFILWHSSTTNIIGLIKVDQ